MATKFGTTVAINWLYVNSNFSPNWLTYRDSTGNTVEETSSIFSLIRMR